MRIPLIVACTIMLAFHTVVLAVDRSKFRTCAQTGFCAHYRNTKDAVVLGAFNQQWTVSGNLFTISSNTVTGGITATMTCLKAGTVRVTIKDGSTRFDPSHDLLVDLKETPWVTLPGRNSYACRGELSKTTIIITSSSPVLKIEVRDETAPQSDPPLMIFGDRGLVYYESSKATTTTTTTTTTLPSDPAAATPQQERKIRDWGEDGKPIYEDEDNTASKEDDDEPATTTTTTVSPTTDRAAPETFGGVTDTKKNGPQSVGFDVSFPSLDPSIPTILYGLPEHATSFALKNTDGTGSNSYSEPYRLYNLDVFEYELNEPMSLYGAVPIVLARSHTASSSSSPRGRVTGLFFNNPTETFVDVSTSASEERRQTRWMAEAGYLDIFIYPGNTLAAVMDAHTRLTGRPQLPPLFALAYHQCRWNYRDQRDMEEIHAKFEELDFPVDVIWLDIEHTDAKKYFTWDKTKFPDPTKMMSDLDRFGRKLVTIVDPHVKREVGYNVHDDATSKNMYLKDDGKDYEGWCWPGSSSYPDFTSAKVRQWWGDYYKPYLAPNHHIWNDMNEPSVFNGPEVTMKKSVTNLDGMEHREWHNLYGYYYHRTTFEGMITARPDVRPFVLTRSVFAGSQTLGAVWTGDIHASFDHLKSSVPMLLSLGVGGIPFAGADVGGFFKDPTTDLLVRWYQLGSLQPFFRAHAHIDTKRREPWLFGEEVLSHIRKAVMNRYRILPYIYTVFEEAHRTGMPIMRPLWWANPSENIINEDRAWLLGGDIFVHPIVDEGATYVEINLPAGLWYDVFTRFDDVGGASGTAASGPITVHAPLDKIPVFQRAGSVIPKRLRLRRSASLMRNDPYTLAIALSRSGTATGKLFVDDFETISAKGFTAMFDVTLAGNVLSIKNKVGGVVVVASEDGNSGGNNMKYKVERIIVMGMRCVAAINGGTAKQSSKQWKFDVECMDKTNDVVVLRKPWVDVNHEFELVIGAS